MNGSTKESLNRAARAFAAQREGDTAIVKMVFEEVTANNSWQDFAVGLLLLGGHVLQQIDEIDDGAIIFHLHQAVDTIE